MAALVGAWGTANPPDILGPCGCCGDGGMLEVVVVVVGVCLALPEPPPESTVKRPFRLPDETR